METALSKILSKADINHLPTIPKVLLDLMDAFQHSNIDFEHLLQIIDKDASLSAKVLAAANSPFYRQWGELKDLNRVIVVLGFNTLKTITMTTAVQQFFNQIPASQQSHLDAIWQRSLTCAFIARKLAIITQYESPDQAYLTGLLHKLGQLILLQCFPKQYAELITKHSVDIDPSLEKQSIGVSNTEIGAHLLESWSTKSFMADAILYQSSTKESITDSPLLIKLINFAAKISQFTTTNHDDQLEQAYQQFGLNQAIIEEMLVESEKHIEKTAGSLGLTFGKSSNTEQSESNSSEASIIQQRLKEYVKNISLLGATHQTSEIPFKLATVISTIQRDFNILFGFRMTAVFLFNQEQNSLQAFHFGDSENEKLWASFEITLQENRSLIANALLHNKIMDSFSHPLPEPEPVIDHQICRLLGSEGMLAIPLMTKKSQSLGVIVVNYDKSDIRRVKSKFGLIALFARESGSFLLNYQNITGRIQESITNTRTGFEIQARKISHEVSNPLSIINNYIYLLGKKLGDSSPEVIKLIQEEISRVGEIMLRLSDLPESNYSDQDEVNINELIQDLILLFQEGIFSNLNIAVQFNMDKRLTTVATSQAKVKQILTNLIKNAAESFSEGGNITIETVDSVLMGGKTYFEIDITDDGPGISDEIKQHLFTPVNSTKGKGHSGLGLTIVKSLVDELGGIIGCHTSHENGTSFQIFIPRKPSHK